MAEEQLVATIDYYGSQLNNLHLVMPYLKMPVGLRIDVFHGSGAILLNSTRAHVEFMIDLDGRAHTFMRTVRDNVEGLARYLLLTPWSADELGLASAPLTGDETDIEIAGRFAFTCLASMNRGNSSTAADFRTIRNPKGRYASIRDDIDRTIRRLYGAAARLRGVQIVKADAVDYLSAVGRRSGKRLIDYEDSMIMADPPFPARTRSGSADHYTHDTSDDLHRRLFGVLNDAAGYVFVMGHANELYSDLYETAGWLRIGAPYQVNGGAKKVISAWLNPRLRDVQVDMAMQLPFVEETTPEHEINGILTN